MDHQNELELSSEAHKGLIDAALEYLTEYIEGIDRHALDLSHEADPEMLHSLIEPVPEEGMSVDTILRSIFEQGSVYSLNPTSPGFMGYVPGGGLLHAGVADLIANALNRYVGVVAVAPVFAQLESNVIRWFSEIVGYPETAKGTLTSGGSLASLSAIITARHALLGKNFLDGVIYVSDQAHHCVAKAALLAGFPEENIRIVASDWQFRLSLNHVEAAIRKDRKRGLRPFMVVGSAGTTNTGAVDPLPALHELAQREGLWFHVDGAYGGFFSMTERGKEKLSGIEQADSVVLDPHKTLFLPYGTGALLVKDGALLRAAHASTAAYMPPMQDDDVAFDFCELSPELTRPFRGLRIWLPMKMHGISVFRAYLDEKLDLAQWIQTKIKDIPDLELIAPAELSILAFACKGATIEKQNERTKALIRRINQKNRVYLTGTMVNGRYVIRVAISAFRTHKDRVEMLLEDMLSSLEEMAIIHS